MSDTPEAHPQAWPGLLAGEAWLARETTRTVLDLLNRDGHEARAVGGAVRNALMGCP